MNAGSTKMEYEWALMCSERNTPADAAQIKKSSYEYSCPAHFAAHLRSSSLKRNFQNGKPSRRNARFWPDWTQPAFSRPAGNSASVFNNPSDFPAPSKSGTQVTAKISQANGGPRFCNPS